MRWCFSAAVALLSLCVSVPQAAAADAPVTTPSGSVLYVSPQGNDSFSGRLAEINAAKSDGPLATLIAARNKVRELKNTGRLNGPATVYLRGGRYVLEQPVVFTPEDSAPVTYASYPGEEAILDGGRPITGWQPTRVNDRAAWVVELPQAKQGKWYFRELFVDGQRRPRARLPKTGVYQIAAIPAEFKISNRAKGRGFISDAFVSKPGEVRDYTNLKDVEAVVLHFWSEDRCPIASFDPASNLVKLARVPFYPLIEDDNNPFARYYLDNVFEALTEPGEWYLDRPTGKLYYLPMPGEDPARTAVFAPRATQLLRLAGRPDDGQYVEFLRFQNLTFAHTDWYQPELLPAAANRTDYNPNPHRQSASHLAGAIQLVGARACAIEDCKFEHLGWYGLELGDGCLGNRIVGNELADIGGGGLRMTGSDATGPLARRTGNNRVTNNHIHHVGRVFHSGAGILAMNTFGNTLSHNHIHDLYQNGISCGWVWGYGETVARDNRIEKNHIHDLGFGLLSDIGGIYTLGGQLGTVIRHNLVHHITCSKYGAWCIYPDEGSSHLLIENNLGYDTNSQIFMTHYGRENLVRNNIFAFGSEGIIRLARTEAHNAFNLERNIFITDGQPVYRGGYAGGLEEKKFRTDLNLIWDVSGVPLLGRNKERPQGEAVGTPIGPKVRSFDAAQWRELGQDWHSVVADPLFKNLAKRDFTLSEKSPALPLGFQPFDLSDVGPRPVGKRD